MDHKAREQLAEALEFVRDGGDTLVVTRLDRLARSVAYLKELLNALQEKGAALRVVYMNFDTRTRTGKLMLTVLGGVAEFERETMLERQRGGIAKAKAAGKYKGRQPTARAKSDEVHELKAAGIGASGIAQKVGISRASVYRILGEA